MTHDSSFRLQVAVFALVSAAFTNIYITQPVLPVLQQEFGADMVRISFTVSAVILGIALSNLPFGLLADRLPIHPIIFTGGIMVALCGLFCAVTRDLWFLIGARFIQGLFIPAMTTCLAAYIAKTLPYERLNVVMGAYVSATVLGGLTSRLIGGWIHPPLHWRYAFVTTSVLILIATFSALRVLPRSAAIRSLPSSPASYWALLRRWDLLRIFFCAAGSFAIFSSVFNYLPFRLGGAPFHFSTGMTTSLYLVYVLGIFIGPVAGKLSNRFGSGTMLIGGGSVLAVALALILIPSTMAVVFGLLSLCAGFFTIHSAAVGSLNRKLRGGQGRANALYVLFYYAGGWSGITLSGFAYAHWGWNAVVALCAFILAIPFGVGIREREIAGGNTA
jgi:MFS transporter, YNFM family, putative membrane transport protein